MAIMEPDDFRAESHRKGQNLDPAPAGNKEMAELMKKDDDA
jgi:hypothetical protein